MDLFKGIFGGKKSTTSDVQKETKTQQSIAKPESLEQKGVDMLKNEIDNFSDPFDVENRKPMWSFMGITDLSLWDLSLGFASGVYARDVREEWHECFGGPLMMLKSMTNLAFEFFNQDFTNPIGVITNFVLLQHMVDLMMKIVSGGP